MKALGSAGSLVAGLFLVGGCGFNDGDANPRTGVFTLAAPSVWAGETIQVRGHDFKYDDPILFLDDAVLAHVRFDDTTVGGLVPANVGGDHEVSLTFEGQSTVLGNVSIHGYVGHQVHPYSFVDDIQLYPRGSQAALMGLARVNGQGLTFLNLDTGAGALFPIGNYDGLHSPGPTIDPTVFVLRSEHGGPLLRYRFGATPTLIDTIRVNGTHYLMQLNDTTWVAFFSQSYSVGGKLAYNDLNNASGRGMVTSPAGDRATFKAFSRYALPVFDRATGDTAFSLDIREVMGVDFSADGSLLAVSGVVPSTTISKLVLVRAGNGNALADTTFSTPIFTVRFDPSLPYLYVGVVESGRPGVLVYDTNTLKLLHHLRTPEAAPACSEGCYQAVIVRGANDVLHVAGSWDQATTTDWRFRLPH